MPCQPRFSVDQNETEVILSIHVPYVRVSDMEFFIDATHFSFYCKPYLLNLTFPFPLVDDATRQSRAVYDVNEHHGTIRVHALKEIPGTHFPDLEFLTTLLQPQKRKAMLEAAASGGTSSSKPLIEVLNSSMSSIPEEEVEFEPAPTEKHPFLEVKQQANIQLSNEIRYGFHNRHANFFKAWQGQIHELVELPNPDNVHPCDRSALRKAKENETFDLERYLGDFFDAESDMMFQSAVDFESPMWISSLDESMARCSLSTGSVSFTDSDQELMTRFPNREYLSFSTEERRTTCFTIIDVLIGYVYDHRLTQGEPNVESPWTIAILSPSLSWLDPATNMRDVLNTGAKRMCTYPYLRHFRLVELVYRDVLAILKAGKHTLLRCFLSIYRIFETSETKYLLNNLFLEDLCVWIPAHLTEAHLKALALEFEAALVGFGKHSLEDWNLLELEEEAKREEEAREASGSDSGSSSSGASSEESDQE